MEDLDYSTEKVVRFWYDGKRRPKTVDKYEVPQIVIMKVQNDSNTNVDPSVDAI